MNKAFQEVLKFAEKATHEHTRGFSNRCSQCVQIRDANDPTQTTTKEPELQKIRSESRHEGRLLTLPHRRSKDHECVVIPEQQVMQCSMYVLQFITALRQSQWLQSTVMLFSTSTARHQLEH